MFGRVSGDALGTQFLEEAQQSSSLRFPSEQRLRLGARCCKSLPNSRFKVISLQSSSLFHSQDFGGFSFSCVRGEILWPRENVFTVFPTQKYRRGSRLGVPKRRFPSAGSPLRRRRCAPRAQAQRWQPLDILKKPLQFVKEM